MLKQLLDGSNGLLWFWLRVTLTWVWLVTVQCFCDCEEVWMCVIVIFSPNYTAKFQSKILLAFSKFSKIHEFKKLQFIKSGFSIYGHAYARLSCICMTQSAFISGH